MTESKPRVFVRGWSGIHQSRDVVGMISVIGNPKTDVFSQIALQCQIPFFDDRIFVVDLRGEIEELCSRLGDIRGEGIRERKHGEPVGADGIAEESDITGFDGPSVNCSSAQQRLDEPPVTAPQHGFGAPANSVSESDPGRKVFFR